jgi:hypothetical protein
VQGIDTSRPNGVRNRVLLLLGPAGAFRRDELARGFSAFARL